MRGLRKLTPTGSSDWLDVYNQIIFWSPIGRFVRHHCLSLTKTFALSAMAWGLVKNNIDFLLRDKRLIALNISCFLWFQKVLTKYKAPAPNSVQEDSREDAKKVPPLVVRPLRGIFLTE